MKLRAFVAAALACLSPQFANAAILCVDAGGYYGFIRIAEKSNVLTIEAKQGYAYQISKQLGFPEGREASEISVSMPSRCRTSGDLIQCQAPALVSYRTFGNGSGKLSALVDLQIAKKQIGHTTVSLAIAVPSMARVGRVAHDFRPFLGECKGTLK